MPGYCTAWSAKRSPGSCGGEAGALRGYGSPYNLTLALSVGFCTSRGKLNAVGVTVLWNCATGSASSHPCLFKALNTGDLAGRMARAARVWDTVCARVTPGLCRLTEGARGVAYRVVLALRA